ncbi:hypothetical protein [Sulfuricurvum sp.]|uniref:hypothetical protein n=1 Tax=Sulfuricurvum sp. TaxID=2025608 RepID=UPI003C3A1B26
MRILLSALVVSASLWGYGEGVLYWTPHGCDEGKASASKHGGHGKDESAMFALMNNEGNTSATLILPNLSEKSLPLKNNTVILPKPPMGGYYAMVAEATTATRVQSAVRYLSLHGRPAKVSPTSLTALSKTTLEIVPDPLHREHDRYTASKSYRFILNFQGKPLKNATVTLETHKTPVQNYMSDETGAFTITLPNDFTDVRVGRSENKPSEFLLCVHHNKDFTEYTSTFSMPYYVNPNDFWQSQSWGTGAIFIGFLGGLLLYRRHKKQGVARG